LGYLLSISHEQEDMQIWHNTAHHWNNATLVYLMATSCTKV